MKDISKMAKSITTYFLGTVLSKVIVFFMLPLYTTYIPASDMGLYDSAIALSTFFATVLFLDIGIGIMRFMFEKDKYGNEKYIINSGIIIFLLSMTSYLLISLVIGLSLSFDNFIWIVLYGVFLALNTLYGFIVRSYGWNAFFAGTGIIATAINVICNLILILVFKMDYKALYISHIISMGIRCIIMEVKCRLIFNFRFEYFNKTILWKLLLFSLPLCLNSVAYWMLTSANKIIVTSVLGPEFNGYLAIAVKFTSIIYLLSSCFQLAWQELAFSKSSIIKEDTGLFYTKAFDFYARILIIGLLLIIPAIKLFLLIFPNFIDASYADSIVLIPLALTGTIFSIASIFLGSIFASIKKTNVTFISMLIGAVVNLVVIFSLINVIGVMAANIGFALGFLSTAAIMIVMLNKLIGLKVKITYIIFLFVSLAITIFVFDNMLWYFNIIIFLIFIIIGVFMLRKEIKVIIANILR